jgi:hypothetical protein
MIVPGSGEYNYDSRLPNPFSTEKEIKDWNVRALLEKIPYDMIVIDPTSIGTTGTRSKDYNFDKNVKIDENLKKELESIGFFLIF